MSRRKTYIKTILFSMLLMIVTDALSIWLQRFVKSNAYFDETQNILVSPDMPHNIIIPIAAILVAGVLMMILFYRLNCFRKYMISTSYCKMVTTFLKYKVVLFLTVQYIAWYFKSIDSLIENPTPMQIIESFNNSCYLILFISGIIYLVSYIIFALIVIVKRDSYMSEIVITNNGEKYDLLTVTNYTNF